MILHGDIMHCIKELGDNSVDSIVTDPPYELGFMGKSWDNSGIAYNVEMWRECLRVLKPGGHLLSFGGSRTYHRMACAIEDAGFEIRDQISYYYSSDIERNLFLDSLTPEQKGAFLNAFGRPSSLDWVYASGFPKSHNVGLSIDKLMGHGNRGHRIAVANRHHPDGTLEPNGEALAAYEPKSDEGKPFSGFGTALKPAHEPLVVARKPLSENTVAANVLKHGTGAINIDGCRIPGEAVPINKLEKWSGFGQEKCPDYEPTVNNKGRWPANLILDGSDEVLAGFPQTKSGTNCVKRSSGKDVGGNAGEAYGDESRLQGTPMISYGDEGSAARFFYCSKASAAERHDGLGERGNAHPTVKPLALMRYLVRLVTPPGGLVLDPFTGSGSTGVAALKEGFRFQGIELQAEYVAIAERRLAKVAEDRHNEAPLFAGTFQPEGE